MDFLYWLIPSVLLLAVLVPLILTLLIARKIYLYHFRRESKEKWARECSWNENKEQVDMYENGLKWGEENKAFLKDVHIAHDGLNLNGQFFDFGYDKTVFIHQGRTEACKYSYFFARPYAESGYNVLVIDPRAHGLSDGKFNTLGYKESGDILAWAKYLHDEFSQDHIIMHGVCIGAAAALYALTDAACPDYMEGLVVEGMYENFYDSFKNHIIELKHPTFPVLQECNMLTHLYTGFSMKFGPKDVIGKYEKPLLMLHSNTDPYSLPEKALKLFEACPSKHKKFRMFPKGQHSHLRAVFENEYDDEIKAFLKENF
ncbi:MAG: alpha/beta hydrolase [Clostridia bacterium]|nr:alpha/beta hydrolase [Clostridia bacterium]